MFRNYSVTISYNTPFGPFFSQKWCDTSLSREINENLHCFPACILIQLSDIYSTGTFVLARHVEDYLNLFTSDTFYSQIQIYRSRGLTCSFWPHLSILFGNSISFVVIHMYEFLPTLSWVRRMLIC
jgi:hypothetical protein